VTTPVYCRIPLQDHDIKTWTSRDGTEEFIYLLQDSHLLNICKILHDIIETYNKCDGMFTSKALMRRAIDEAVVAAVALRYVGYELHLRNIVFNDVDMEKISPYISDADFMYRGFVHNESGMVTFK
jgi:hypothetical protein